jgi:hypothetical protein
VGFASRKVDAPGFKSASFDNTSALKSCLCIGCHDVISLVQNVGIGWWYCLSNCNVWCVNE